MIYRFPEKMTGNLCQSLRQFTLIKFCGFP